MTDHGHWLEVAATSPAFPPTGADATGLAAHLATCPSCSRRTAALRGDLAAVAAIGGFDPGAPLRERIRRSVGAAAERRGLSPILVIALLGLLLAAAVGATVTVGGMLLREDSPLPPLTGLPDLAAKRIVWQTDVVHLGADRVELRANGRVLHAETNQIRVSGDPGSPGRWTLEVKWLEAGLEQRVNLYFRSDGSQWWIDEVRAYDGVGPGPEWATFPEVRLAVTPLGGTFHGDIVASGKGQAGPVDLRISGAVLAVTPRPIAGGGLTSDPFLPGGPLHCSGILQRPPPEAERELLARGYPVTWRYESSKDGTTGASEVLAHAPPVGWITSTAIAGTGELIVFVSDPVRPLGPPAELPRDCGSTGSG